MSSVKVAVRVRPFNQRELDMGTASIICMDNNTTGILNVKANNRDSAKYKEFTFDYSYWSLDKESESFAPQELIYNDLGREVVDCAFQGYNACVFAYGQTGSGKTYTMMGADDEQGLIPRICKALFDTMLENSKIGTTHRVQVSYLEIYQERVVDLLRERDTTPLRVREHPKRGPYVHGLTTCIVTNYDHIQDCMNKGNTRRTTAATCMNDVSSRSHAIFTITFVQAGYCDGVPSETVSKIHLVDLAGSERADSTGATGQRLKEGAHINKSLVTLGSVISTLAEQSIQESNDQRKTVFIPYRDSVLTWLLKDSLGGNSKTFMIATISPASCNYGETLSTLRYANRAKNIINKPTINEDPNVKLIRELRDEISKLKAAMFSEHRIDMLAQLHEKEALEKELTEEWAGKWREAQAILREQRALGLRKSGHGVVLDSDRPHLVAIDDDPLSTGVTLYHLKEGVTTIGTAESETKQDIELKGAGMEPQHCTVTLRNGIATLSPTPGAQVMLNNTLIDSDIKLYQGCIIFLGKAHVFRFNDPAEAAELRKGDRPCNLSRLSILSWSTPDLVHSMENLQTYPNDHPSDTKPHNLSKDLHSEQFDNSFRRCSEDEKENEDNFGSENCDISRNKSTGGHSAKSINRIEPSTEKIKELVSERVNIEKERERLCSQINSDYDQLQDTKTDILIKLNNACQFIVLHRNRFYFTPHVSKTIEECTSTLLSQGLHTGGDYNFWIDILNCIRGPSIVQNLIVEQKRELLKMQNELSQRIELLTERHKAVESLDKRLVELIDEQVKLTLNQRDECLETLKSSLLNRSKEELQRIEKKKESLTLNLKKINSVENSSTTTSPSTISEKNLTSVSSDTYHTAQSTLSTNLNCNLRKVSCNHNNNTNLMSDSGVELRPYSQNLEDSDLSSEDCTKSYLSDTPSTSSMETLSPMNRRKRKENEILRRLAQRIIQQKNLIMRTLDTQCPKEQLDKNIVVLQQLQRKYMLLKFGSKSLLVPTQEHPLVNTSTPESSTASTPMHYFTIGSTSSLNFMSTQRRFPLLNTYDLHRSLPTVSDVHSGDKMITISRYILKGSVFSSHYEYEITITTVDDRWTIMRRYRRFRDLYLAMRARYGNVVSSIPFPSRKFIFFSNTDHVAQARKHQLQFYLRCLIERCKLLPTCPLVTCEEGLITKSALHCFSPFFTSEPQSVVTSMRNF